MIFLEIYLIRGGIFCRQEPLLAIYHPNDFDDLLKYYQTHQKSLRFFLQQKSAIKIIPAQLSSIRSFDTKDDFDNWENNTLT